MKSKKVIAALCTLAVVVSSVGGLPFGGLRLFDTAVTASAADEVSENISLVASASSNLSTISGTHYSVSCGYMVADDKGMRVNSFGALTINARKGETISKVILSYSEGGYRNTLSASIGTFDGNSTITGINAQQVSISSTSTTGVIISAVTVYFEGDLNNPTVTLTGGAYAKSSGGLLTQSYLPGAMDTVTYTALTGATFPEFETYTLNGVTVERTSDTVVTISGTPTANTAIIVPDAVSSSKIVTWNSTTISSISSIITKDYTYTANGITLNKTGKGKIAGNEIKGYDSTASFEFTTATGKFTNIEIAASAIYNGGNWTTVGNTLKWNGTPSNSVSLSGSGLYLEGVSSINFVIEMPADLSNATVTLGADNTVSSVTVGGNEITDLSEFDITYGTDESHTATEPPTEDGTYYAYVTAKTESENYTGTAKSAAFTVASAASDPTYTITIPAAVDLKSTDHVNITAEGVTLNEGQKIVVTLDGASHTTSGNVFNAMNDDSVVTYKINGGNVGLGDNKTVAEFTDNGSAELSFAVDSTDGIKLAGAHTETLTFGVKLEEPAAPKIYNKNSENIADGVVLENVGDTIDTTDTLKGLIFNTSAKMDFKIDGNDETMVFNFQPNAQINGVERMYLDDNRDFICVTSTGKGKLIPDEGKQFRVKYNLEDNRWIIDQV